MGCTVEENPLAQDRVNVVTSGLESTVCVYFFRLTDFVVAISPPGFAARSLNAAWQPDPVHRTANSSRDTRSNESQGGLPSTPRHASRPVPAGSRCKAKPELSGTKGSDRRPSTSWLAGACEPIGNRFPRTHPTPPGEGVFARRMRVTANLCPNPRPRHGGCRKTQSCTRSPLHSKPPAVGDSPRGCQGLVDVTADRARSRSCPPGFPVSPGYSRPASDGRPPSVRW